VFTGRPNKGMKLTARGASVEARQLNPVFGGHTSMESNRANGRKAAWLILVGLSLLHVACPYDAPSEPAGLILPLRSSVVGTWKCSVDDEDWATLTLGWHGNSSYDLTLRPAASKDPGGEEVPWRVLARPRRVGGREIWSMWSETAIGDPDNKFSFARLDTVDADSLTFSSLGDGTSLPARLRGATPEAIATILADPKQTVAEGPIRCRRPKG
jgi:hypothetical protein